jgi:hypothetical protein
MSPVSERYAALHLIDDLTAARAWLSLLSRRRDIPPGAQMMARQALTAVERAGIRLREAKTDSNHPDDTRVREKRSDRKRSIVTRSQSESGGGTAHRAVLHPQRSESQAVQMAN